MRRRVLVSIPIVSAWLAGVAAVSAETLRTDDCLLTPSVDIQLGGAAQGLLKAVHVDRQDRVGRGQVVAELHAEQQEAAYAAARLRAEDDTALETARIWMEFERDQLERAEVLSSRNVISEQGLAERRANFNIRRSEYLAAERDRTRARAELVQSEAALEIRRIRSPIDGVVVERHLDPGEFVREDTPVLRIVDIDELSVEVFLDQRHYRQVARIGTARVFPESGAGASHLARIRSVDPLIDPASGTFRVRLGLANEGNAVAAGARCEVEFDLRQSDDGGG